jgi:hypothetical protein
LVLKSKKAKKNHNGASIKHSSDKQAVGSNNRGPIRNYGVAQIATRKCGAQSGSSAADACTSGGFQFHTSFSIALLP